MNRLQSHFDRHPIQYLGRGCQTVVYGTDQLVVKEIDPNEQVCELGKAFVTNMVRTSHKQGLACLGGLAVPYELPEQISAHTVEETGWWVFKKRRKVERLFPLPIIQEKATETITSALDRTIKCDEATDFADLIDSLITLRERLVGVGAFPHDPMSDNYVLHKGRVLIRDIGGLVLKRGFVKRAVANEPVMKELARINFLPYRCAAAHLASNPKVAKALRAFRKHLDWTYSNEVRASLGKNRNKKPLAFVHFDV